VCDCLKIWRTTSAICDGNCYDNDDDYTVQRGQNVRYARSAILGKTVRAIAFAWHGLALHPAPRRSKTVTERSRHGHAILASQSEVLGGGRHTSGDRRSSTPGEATRPHFARSCCPKGFLRRRSDSEGGLGRPVPTIFGPGGRDAQESLRRPRWPGPVPRPKLLQRAEGAGGREDAKSSNMSHLLGCLRTPSGDPSGATPRATHESAEDGMKEPRQIRKYSDYTAKLFHRGCLLAPSRESVGDRLTHSTRASSSCVAAKLKSVSK
jgi:hypothetical protein